VLAASSSLMSIAGGKKEDSTSSTNNTTTKTKTENLTSSAWRVNAITVNPGIVLGGVTVTEFYAFMDACEKDNTRKFNLI